MGFFNDVTAVVPEQTGTKPPRREIRAGPNKRCNTIYVFAMMLSTYYTFSRKFFAEGEDYCSGVAGRIAYPALWISSLSLFAMFYNQRA